MKWIFEGGWGSWAGTLLCLALAALLVLAYLDLRRGRRWSAVLLPLLLRLGALAALLLIFFQPTLHWQKITKESPTLGVLLDSSASMGVSDAPGTPPRLAQARDWLVDRGLAGKLAERGTVRLFTFAEGLSEVASPKDLPKAATGRSTDLAGAIEKAAGHFRGREAGCAGLVLFTDGRQPAGEAPLAAAQAAEMPIYAVLVGRPKPAPTAGPAAARRDVELVGLEYDQRVVVGWQTKVTVRLRATGFAGTPFPVRLLQGEAVLAESVVQGDAAGALQEAVLPFRPEKAGRYVYTVRVPPLPGEADPTNNEQSFTVHVVERANRVLYVEGTPRWEFKFLKRALGRQEELVLSSLLRTKPTELVAFGEKRPEELALPATAQELLEYQVILLGDVRRDFFRPEQLAALRDFVAEGGGLVVLGGSGAFGRGGYAGTPLAEVLPVEIRPADVLQAVEVQLALTTEGRASPIFAGADLDWNSAPSLISLMRVGNVRAGGTVLATADASVALGGGGRGGRGGRGGAGGGGDPPLVVAQQFGQGKVVVLLTDSLWRWKLGTGQAGNDAGWYDRFWKQLVAWLLPEEKAAPKTNRLVLETDRDEYRAGEEVRLLATLLGPDGRFVADGQVGCELTAPDGRKLRFELAYGPLSIPDSPLTAGYATSFVPPLPGRYAAAGLAHARDGSELGRAETEFLVRADENVEMQNTEPDEDLLRRLARATGGGFCRLEESGKLLTEVRAEKRVLVEAKSRSLWDRPWLFAVFFAFVALEWFVRKRRAID